MVGHDRLLSAALAAGASGSITAAASVVPELVAATARDPGRQPELDVVRELLESFGLGPAVKAILRDRGLGAYRTRPPLLDLDDDRRTELLGRFALLVG
jgi:dihydrodipicolinate synthase/N-acetylneuraminate lyase